MNEMIVEQVIKLKIMIINILSDFQKVSKLQFHYKDKFK